MTNQEGYIKFQCDWQQKSFAFSKKNLTHINAWREKLYELELIGITPEGIGYGNISLREEKTNRFIITGSKTGKHDTLDKQHYARVIDYNIDQNYIQCVGQVKASSESLTHAAIYNAAPEINAVVHIHHGKMWRLLKNKLPTTSPEAEYGTPQMAREIQKLLEEKDVRIEKIIVMGGHEEGIVTFGRDLDEAGDIVLKYFNQIG